MATRNFGIGSRDMAVAGRMIVDRNFHGGYQSKRDISQRWGYFAMWAYEQGVKKMENVTFALVVEYGQQLQRELDAIEVGQPVTRLPPHRSLRAELPHRALLNCSRCTRHLYNYDDS